MCVCVCVCVCVCLNVRDELSVSLEFFPGNKRVLMFFCFAFIYFENKIFKCEFISLSESILYHSYAKHIFTWNDLVISTHQ